MAKLVYQYDVLGNRVDVHFNANEASIKTQIKVNTILTSINRKSLVNNNYYFTFDKEFKLPVGAKQVKPMITTRSEYVNTYEL